MERNIFEKQRELNDRLNRYRDEYYNRNAPSVSDEVYDRLFDELKELEQETGIQMANSPTQTVGYPAVSRLEKTRHEIPLLSLDKTKSSMVLLNFMGEQQVMLMLKLDGLTVKLTYENGELLEAATRGDGDEGEIITHNTRAISGIPSHITYKERLVVTGEGFIRPSDFEELKTSLQDSSGKPYKNGRNLAAGSIRLMDAKICQERRLVFMPFGVLEGFPHLTRKSDKLRELRALGFQPCKYLVTKQKLTLENVEAGIYQLRQYATDKDIPIDGIVVSFNDIAYAQSCGHTGHHYKDGLAYKFEDDLHESLLQYIEWTPGRTGEIAPVAVFTPVEIDGCEVSRASLHNLSFIEDLELMAGNRILVSKRNMIIPHVEENLDRGGFSMADTIPHVCPCCGQPTRIHESSGKGEHCNINSLTLKNLKASDSVNRNDSFFTLLEEGQQYTFEEMYQLWHQKEVYVRLYTMLTPLPVDQRLLTLRQLIKRELVSQYTGDTELEQLGKCLLERPFSEWYRSSFGHIRGLTRRTAMELLQHYTKLQTFIPAFTAEPDAVFALNNMTALLERTDWKQVRKDILTTDADWLELKDKLVFSDDFVEQNRETVTEFLLRGDAAMVRALYGELDGQELAVEALRRIVQAELMGQFYKLKYFAGDLQREIRYPVSEMQESLWKKNLSLARGAFLAEEVDDFYHTLRLGELPHGTCLSYRTGSQRECLLAAFDSNKKIILVKKDETVVARACLRLTKGAFQKPPAIDFSFADLSQENTATGKSAAGEKAVLFLESVYTSRLNDIEKEEVMKLAVSLTTQKAAELGVVAVLARKYLGCYERDEYVLAPFYVYISKSKNGWQYLDSLGGAAYTSAKEEYVEHPFLVIQTAMHHAGAHNRNEVDYE